MEDKEIALHKAKEVRSFLEGLSYGAPDKANPHIECIDYVISVLVKLNAGMEE